VAVKELIQSGIIVQPDAVEFLKSTISPIDCIKKYLANPNRNNILSANDLKLIVTMQNTIITVSNSDVNRPKIPRRTTKTRSTRQSKSSQNVKSQIKLNNIGLQTSLDDLTGLSNYESKFNVVSEVNFSENLSGNIQDLIGYFQDRYQRLSSIFRGRRDIPYITSIKNLKRSDNEVSIIGMVVEKQFNPTGGGIIILEDPTIDRSIQAVIPKSNAILLEEAVQIMDDSVICVIGNYFNEVFIAKEILLPDIPYHKKNNRADIPVHAAFLSDIHIGSKNFLEQPLLNFINFLNGEYGNNKMRLLGQQTKYVLFSGDVVDGVGIYPNQHNDLSIDSIREQYQVFAQYLEKIPEDVEIVIIPGNHDMVRSAEPQPRIPPEYAPALNSMKNVHLLPNPTQVQIHGVETLMYHCTSLPDILNHIPGLQADKPVEVMRQMLRARHLAPIWGSKTPLATEPRDHLVIDRIPDIFHGGHIHINGEGYYRGVQILNSGTMQNQTSFQKSLNIIPTPGQVTVTNLKSFGLNKIDFLSS